jgi:hypothetical protein
LQSFAGTVPVTETTVLVPTVLSTVSTVWIVKRSDGSLVTDFTVTAPSKDTTEISRNLTYSHNILIWNEFPCRFNSLSSSLLVEERRVYSHLFIIRETTCSYPFRWL